MLLRLAIIACDALVLAAASGLPQGVLEYVMSRHISAPGQATSNRPYHPRPILLMKKVRHGFGKFHSDAPYSVVLEERVPYIVEKPVHYQVRVPVEKRYPVHYPVEKEVLYPVVKEVPVEVKVPVDRLVPYKVEKPVPRHVEKLVPYPVVKEVPVPVKVPYRVEVAVPYFVRHAHPTAGETTLKQQYVEGGHPVESSRENEDVSSSETIPIVDSGLDDITHYIVEVTEPVDNNSDV